MPMGTGVLIGILVFACCGEGVVTGNRVTLIMNYEL